MLCVKSIHLEEFRCFARLDLSFESDLTLLFSENAGGKTAVLTAVAMGLAFLQPRQPKDLTLTPRRDVRTVSESGSHREPAGPCTMSWTATIGSHAGVEWSTTASAKSRSQTARLKKASEAIEMARQKGERWPLIAYYGTGRFADNRKPFLQGRLVRERWEGYDGSLDPSPSDRRLLEWLMRETLADFNRHRTGEPERRFDVPVLSAMRRATPGILDVTQNPGIEMPEIRFETGQLTPWSELSDGFHIYMALVGDIAHRAMILNGQYDHDAPLLVEGVVLIDEIDLHLHPRWQRVVLDGLRAAFPKLQFIVTTHSPQVLSSALNRQVRRLADGKVKTGGLFVEGRDTNSILREVMGGGDRDDAGRIALRDLNAALDEGRFADARAQFESLRKRWGNLDPELIRAEVMIEEEM